MLNFQPKGPAEEASDGSTFAPQGNTDRRRTMRQVRKALLGTAAIVLGFGVVCSADTLQMKNGDVFQGRYLGGSERAVQFEANGKIKLYEVDEILSITFTNPAPAPADDVPAAPHDSAMTVTVPAGTRLVVRMIDSVDSATNHVGDRFHASLENDLIADGMVVAPKGADVYGRLAEAQQAGNIAGKAQLKLELTDISIHNRLRPIVTGEYELAGASRGANTAKKAAGGAALGAIIGAIAGGGKGAAIGAGVGAGAGTAVNVVTRGEQVRVPSETVLDFRLEQSLTVHVL
jgi:hypothetical protein